MEPDHISFDGEIGTCIDKGFVSSSLSIDVAARFSDMETCCILAFTLPTNIYGLKIDTEEIVTEEEILLQRNLEFFNIRYEKIYDDIKVYSCGVRPYRPPGTDEMNSIEQTTLYVVYNFNSLHSISIHFPQIFRWLLFSIFCIACLIPLGCFQ